MRLDRAATEPIGYESNCMVCDLRFEGNPLMDDDNDCCFGGDDRLCCSRAHAAIYDALYDAFTDPKLLEAAHG